MPSEVPGLAGLLGVALFSGERVERLGTGAALGALPFAAAVSVALGRALVDDVDACDYGIQRSFLRLLTKIGHPEGHAFFSAFASGQPADEGARLAVAWALGTGSGNDDEAHLAQLASTSTAVTRRVVTLAAQRRGFWPLVERLSIDSDPQVSGEARRALDRHRADTAAAPASS